VVLEMPTLGAPMGSPRSWVVTNTRVGRQAEAGEQMWRKQVQSLEALGKQKKQPGPLGPLGSLLLMAWGWPWPVLDSAFCAFLQELASLSSSTATKGPPYALLTALKSLLGGRKGEH
jgi:hypothetical protein